MPEEPIVSAIMPTYNTAAHIGAAIDSVLAQTFTDWELIVVDDCSTDETPALLARYTDPRINIIRLDRNQGSAAARNVALQGAKGRYIAPCDSDDISLPARFERLVAFLDSHAEIDVVASQMQYFWEEDAPQSYHLYPEDSDAIDRRFARGRMAVPFGASMIRRSCFERFGLLCEDLRRAQDLEWFLRIRRHSRFRVLPEFLYLYRRKPAGTTWKKWMAEARYDAYAAYRAEAVQEQSAAAVLPFEQFTRRRRTRLRLATYNVLRYINLQLRSRARVRALR